MQIHDSMRLESGEPDFPTHDVVKEGNKKALDENKTSYPHSSGVYELRNALLKKCREENGIPLGSPNDIIITNGGVGAICCSLAAVVDPFSGDEIIIPDPNWGTTEILMKFCSGIPVKVELERDNGFRLNPSDLERKISPRTKAVVINSPHNPTGAVYSRQDLQEIISIAEKHGIYLLSDEAYEHIVYDAEHISPASLSDYKGIISLFTFSKSFAIPGLRVGYTATKNKDVMENLQKTVFCTANGVNSIAQYGSLEGLEHELETKPWIQSMVLEYRKRRDILAEGIASSRHLELTHLPQGAFYVFPRIKNFDGSDKDFGDRLLKLNPPIGSVPGSSFGEAGKGYIRFAYSTSTEKVRQAAEILSELKF